MSPAAGWGVPAGGGSRGRKGLQLCCVPAMQQLPLKGLAATEAALAHPPVRPALPLQSLGERWCRNQDSAVGDIFSALEAGGHAAQVAQATVVFYKCEGGLRKHPLLSAWTISALALGLEALAAWSMQLAGTGLIQHAEQGRPKRPALLCRVPLGELRCRALRQLRQSPCLRHSFPNPKLQAEMAPGCGTRSAASSSPIPG